MKFTIFLIAIFAGLNCEVFCRICKVGFEEGNWVRMTPSKKLPLNCIAGGMEDSESYKGPLYIGRKRIGNELVIGKVIDAWKSGYFPKDGSEHWSDKYEVLCQDTFKWIPKGSDMKDAIAGGLAGNREVFFVCSANFNGQQIPGKLFEPTGCCYIPSFGKEHCVTDYAVLATSTTVIEYNVVD